MPKHPLAALACAAALCAPNIQAQTWNTLDGLSPIVIGHRGAAGYRPGHTLEGYALAISMGANYIEPDLVLTRDGALIARHEPVLDATTDIATKFGADRKTTRLLDGVQTTAYFAQDFTLAEIKTLRAVQSNSGRDQSYNGQFQIPTLDEIITLAKAKSIETGRTIGIYPEVKHSTFHADSYGANVFENKLVSTLHAAYGNSASAPVFIQSFESGNLQYLNSQTNIKLVQLIDADDVNADGSMALADPYRQPYDFVRNGDNRTFADLLSNAGLDFVKSYADAIGPWKPYLVTTVADGVDRTGDGKLTINDRRLDGATGVIAAAHARGLLVHSWTFRNDASGYGFADPKAEMAYYFGLGVDGLFTDFADTGVAALAVAAAAVPEPQSWALMLGGAAALLAWRRRRA